MLCGVSQALPRSLTPDGGAVTVARMRASWLLQRRDNDVWFWHQTPAQCLQAGLQDAEATWK